MGRRGGKKEKKKQRPRSPSPESEVSELDENFTLSDVLNIINHHKSWHDLIRDERLFEAGIFETDFEWLKEVWATRKDPSQSTLNLGNLAQSITGLGGLPNVRCQSQSSAEDV